MRRTILFISLIFIIISCQNNKSNERFELIPEHDKEIRLEFEKNKKFAPVNISNLEELAFEGITIDFIFKNNKPSFSDLFLIVGFKNPNFAPKNRIFEKLSYLGFKQVDDYFGIENDGNIGSDILIWLSPIINDKEVFHENGPFDAIRIRYIVRENQVQIVKRLKTVFEKFKENLDVDILFESKKINTFSKIEERINQTIVFCRTELKVEPGSNKALKLDW